MEISCDILVVGAGVAGVAAAIRAAREGADTLLIEKNNIPGGIPVDAMHRYICGLYPSDLHPPENTLNGGIAEEICSVLKELAPETKAVRMGKVYVFPFATKDLINVLTHLTDKQSGLAVFYETELDSVITENNYIKHVVAKKNKEHLVISPNIVIDCSGGGAAIRLSGASYQISPANNRQLSGFSFKIKRIKNQSEEISIKVPYYIAHAVAESKLPPYIKYSKYYPGVIDDEGICVINLPFGNSLENTEKAKNLAVKVHEILAGSISSFKDSYVAEMSSVINEREGLRMTGGYMLTGEDVLLARKFFDGVLKNTWPIELWDRDTGPVYHYIKAGDYYEIPLRCLKSIDIKNLFGAGRCICVSHEALGSTRVMGTCISIGEQAGLAAVKRISEISL